MFYAIIQTFNEYLYSYILIILLLGCGLYFTIRTRGVQFRLIGESIRTLGKSNEGGNGKRGISSFQAFIISLASRVGTGNLAGVAIALTIGGPGAVFWMWITALVGAASGFVEATLAQLYKRRDNKSFIGGPAYYIETGLGLRWMAVLSAILIVITFSFGFSSVQCNTIGAAFESQFGWNHIIVGAIVSIFVGVIIIGGIQRIAKVSSVIVPFMAIGYLLLATIVIVMNINRIPEMFKIIIDSAFGFKQATGGMIGVVIMQGVRRGLFSNEAGLGSASNAAATANVSHPVKQGLVQSLGVFIDTLIVCSCTAFIILLSGIDLSGDKTGIELTQQALQSQIGPAGSIFITIALFFFAFSTVIANYCYGEINLRFLTNSKRAVWLLRLGVVVMSMVGFCLSLQTVWEITDFFMGICGLCNLIALVILSPKAFKLLDDYVSQKRNGVKSPSWKIEWWIENSK